MLLRTGTIAPLFCNPRPKISRLGRTLMAATLCYEPSRAANDISQFSEKTFNLMKAPASTFTIRIYVPILHLLIPHKNAHLA